jgi:hypothetical protein
LITRLVLLTWGVPARAMATSDDSAKVFTARPHGLEVLELVQKRQRLLKDAWLTATGHKRPGMNRGLSLTDAECRATAIETKLHALLPGPV